MMETKVQMGFTITRNTLRGYQEVETDKGFKTREWLQENDAEILWYTKEDAHKKVKELKMGCRLPAMRKSYQVNYS